MLGSGGNYLTRCYYYYYLLLGPVPESSEDFQANHCHVLRSTLTPERLGRTGRLAKQRLGFRRKLPNWTCQKPSHKKSDVIGQNEQGSEIPAYHVSPAPVETPPGPIPPCNANRFQPGVPHSSCPPARPPPLASSLRRGFL